MRIGKTVRVTEEPRPIRQPVKEPGEAPARRGTPSPREVPGGPTREPVKVEISYPVWDYLYSLEDLPSECEICGRPLKSVETDSGLVRVCPRHGVLETVDLIGV